MVFPSAETPPFWAEGTSSARTGMYVPSGLPTSSPSSIASETMLLIVWLPRRVLRMIGSCEFPPRAPPPRLGVPAATAGALVGAAGFGAWAADVGPAADVGTGVVGAGPQAVLTNASNASARTVARSQYAR